MGSENHGCHPSHAGCLGERSQGRAKERRSDDGLSGLPLAKVLLSQPANRSERQPARETARQARRTMQNTV